MVCTKAGNIIALFAYKIAPLSHTSLWNDNVQEYNYVHKYLEKIHACNTYPAQKINERTTGVFNEHTGF